MNKFLSFFALLVSSVFLLSIALPPTMAAGIGTKSPRSEIVPYNDWNCGATDFDRPLSHQLAQEDCPKRMFEADMCCRVHDICYMDEHKSQHDCDEAFCYCLDRTVAQPARNANQSVAGCESVSNSYCDIVKLFGGMAYSNSRNLREEQKRAMELLEQSQKSTTTTTTTTTTAAPTTTSSSTVIIESSTTASVIDASSESSATTSSTTTTPSPAELAQFVTHQFPLDCFDEGVSTCTKQLHKCVSERFHATAEEESPGGALLLGVQFAECSAQFCECNARHEVDAAQFSQRMPAWKRGKRSECTQSMGLICSQFSNTGSGSDAPNGKSPGSNLHFWSVNVNYIGASASLGLAFVGSVLLLIALLLLAFLLAKAVPALKRRLALCGSREGKKNYAKSSLRRNTLTALRSVSGDHQEKGPHYMPFGGHAKESTVSSPEGSEAAQQLLCPHLHSHGHREHHHHHKKTHSEGTSPNKLLAPEHTLTLNSSQVHLIGGGESSTGNSSSTLSDLSAAS